MCLDFRIFSSIWKMTGMRVLLKFENCMNLKVFNTEAFLVTEINVWPSIVLMCTPETLILQTCLFWQRCNFILGHWPYRIGWNVSKKCALTLLNKNISGDGPFKSCPSSLDCSQSSLFLKLLFQTRKSKGIFAYPECRMLEDKIRKYRTGRGMQSVGGNPQVRIKRNSLVSIRRETWKRNARLEQKCNYWPCGCAALCSSTGLPSLATGRVKLSFSSVRNETTMKIIWNSRMRIADHCLGSNLT